MSTPSRISQSLLTFAIVLATTGGASAAEWRINCGGPSVTAAAGRVFRSDVPQRRKAGGYVGGAASRVERAAVLAPIGDEALFGTWREDPEAYRIPIANGRYEVTLYIADFDSLVAGQRRFDVDLERQPWLRDFDPRAQAEMGEAIIARGLVQVKDGRLDIDFRAIAGVPIVSAIEVRPWRTKTAAPAAPMLQVLASYGEALLSWTPAFERGIAGYIVETSTQDAGPFTPSTPSALRTLRWRDQTLAAGETRFYRVRAVDIAGRISEPSLVLPVTALDWSASTLPLFRLDVLPADLAQLTVDPFSDDTVPALAAWGDDAWRNGTVRFRGFSARFLPKRSWRVKIKQPSGDDELVYVNANFADPSQIRNRLATDWFQQAGLPVPTTRPIRLSLNGRYAGIYQSVERIDGPWVARSGLAQRFSLYKADGDLTDRAKVERYELETGETAALELRELLDGLARTAPTALPEWLSAHVDVDQVLAWYAVQIAMQNIDFTQKNYFLLHDRDRGHWRLIPWDLDLTFGPTKLLSTQLAVQEPIDFGAQCVAASCFGLADDDSDDIPSRLSLNQRKNGLFARLLQVPRWRRMHARNLQTLIDSVMQADQANPLIESLHQEVASDRARDALRWRLSGERANEAPDRLQRWVLERREFLQREITRWAPASYFDLSINEVRADGNSPGWIEIHNLGLQPSAIDRFVLTVGESNQLLRGLVVPAGGFLTLTRGNELTAAIAPDGSTATLIAPDGTVIDTITWPALLEGGSFGGAIEASFQRVMQAQPTPGAANQPLLEGPPIVISAQLTPAYPRSSDTPQVRVQADRAARVQIVFNAGEAWQTRTTIEDAQSPGQFVATLPAFPDGSQVSWYVRAESTHGGVELLPSVAPVEVRRYRVGDAAPTPVINELLASNRSVLADEAAQFEDWIELFNPGEDPFDLSGFGVSDDPAVLDKWLVPAGVVIPARGYLIIWCDEEPEQGLLHASFKLDKDGESVVLSQPSGAAFQVIDRIDFGLQQRDVSWGRSSDAADEWVAFNTPTPAGPNR